MLLNLKYIVMNNNFKFNGVDYKVVNNVLYQVSDSCLLPVYNPEKQLEDLAKWHGAIPLNIVPSIHTHGNQLGQRAKTSRR